MGMAIRHPNIVSILAVNKDQKSGQYFIVMEFVEGGNLKDILNIRKKLTPEESLLILEEATTGLMFAFSKGMTHRDIKPTNILVSANKISKLVDFGLAELTGGPMGWGEEDTQVDQSVDYGGLEQATGCKPGDIRSDIYFLGCVLYQMLTGQPLLSITKDLRARKQRQRFDVIQLMDRNNPDIPPMVFALLSKMVTLSANDRFQTPSQLLDAIRNVRSELTGQPVEGSTGPAAPSGPKTVYVVEHNAKLQDVFREKLKKSGFRVLISIDAERATQRFQQQPYQALIVDIGTTGEEGIEAFAKVMREADKLNMKCNGILIFNEDQAHLKEKAPVYPNVTCLVRPVVLKHILEALGASES
jgi:serine/threonine protein kinase